MKIHELKLDTEIFPSVQSGLKNFEIRNNDRDYQVGDILKLKAFANEESADYESINVGYALSEHDFEGGYDYWGNCDEYLADEVTAKVTEVYESEQWNRWYSYSEIGVYELPVKCKDVPRVLRDYFKTDRLPEGYVVLGIEVLK
ncbi:MAG: DUF3850 domain-containing protein [Streptococcaceae bacterium]|nr:DUF3850 domain-containing protein [Streptococcaceae bacterium]MCL2681566.1 DUF3850 domain-containing protein [Streptococcaceae bacterium]